jgi:hypothetical protein
VPCASRRRAAITIITAAKEFATVVEIFFDVQVPLLNHFDNRKSKAKGATNPLMGTTEL